MAHPNIHLIPHFDFPMGRRGRDRMVFGFITTYAISAYRISFMVKCIRYKIM